MSKINKVHSINNSYYAQASRARHIHQEKNLEKKLKAQLNQYKKPMVEAKNYDFFVLTALNGFKEKAIKLISKIFKK